MSREQDVKKRALRASQKNPELLAVVKQATFKRRLTASQRAGLIEVIDISRGISSAKKDEITVIKALPALSPMQTRQQLEKIAALRHQIEELTATMSSQLAKLDDLKKEEAAGVAKIKDAVSEVKDMGKYLLETERAMVQWTSYLQEKTPGIAQMIMRPEDAKEGEKAGDFFGRIAAELGEEQAKQVEIIYAACKQDLIHMAHAVKGFKVVVKTSSIHPTIIKNAGILDVVVGMKDWLSGNVSAIAQKILQFPGDIKKWIKGFADRTSQVKKASSALEALFKKSEQKINTMVK